MNRDTVNFLIKTAAIVFSCVYSLICISGQRRLKPLKYALAAVFASALSLILMLLRPHFTLFFLVLILLAAGCAAFSLLLKIRLDFTFTAALLSLAIALVIYTVSAVLSSVLYAVAFGTGLDDYKTYLMLLISQLLLTFFLFSIRRFRGGFPFLQSRTAFIAGLILSGLTLIMISQIGNIQDDYLVFYSVAGIFVTGIGAVFWIRRGITVFYKKKLKENTIEQLERELLQKQEELDAVKEENARISAANHKISQRLNALENSVKALAAAAVSGTAREDEYKRLGGQLEALAAEYKADTMNAPRINTYDKTNIDELDALSELFARECAGKNIAFTVKVSGSINFLTEKLIPLSRLETLIGDHLRDAVIAVESGTNNFRGITMLIGLHDSCYELTVSDSGIPFTAGTLLRLGRERVTTHSGSGGSGIGFMTTFETLRECGASLIITENEPVESDFTKSVTIRFDGNNSYILRTHRAAALSAEAAVLGRDDITIEKLG